MYRGFSESLRCAHCKASSRFSLIVLSLFLLSSRRGQEPYLLSQGLPLRRDYLSVRGERCLPCLRPHLTKRFSVCIIFLSTRPFPRLSSATGQVSCLAWRLLLSGLYVGLRGFTPWGVGPYLVRQATRPVYRDTQGLPRH